MGRRMISVLLLLALMVGAKAQQIDLLFTGGFAGSSMDDMKKLNSTVQQYLPFNTEMTSNFPTTPQFGGIFIVHFGKIYGLGFQYAFSSTGSRLAASDYSGSYHFDNVITGHSIGLVNNFRAFCYKNFGIDLQLNLGTVLSSIKLKEDYTISDTSMTTSAKYTSQGFYIEPRIMFDYGWKLLKTGIYLGYNYNPGGKLKDQAGNKSSQTTSWSGIRFGIILGLQIKTNKSLTSSSGSADSTATRNTRP